MSRVYLGLQHGALFFFNPVLFSLCYDAFLQANVCCKWISFKDIKLFNLFYKSTFDISIH